MASPPSPWRTLGIGGDATGRDPEHASGSQFVEVGQAHSGESVEEVGLVT
ncbi:hypothetical protein [Streptomyces sp. NPDC059278]